MQQEEDETLEGDGRGDHSELLQAARDGDTPTGLRRLLGGGGRSREGSMNKGQRAGGSGEPSPLAARPR